jgi:predicted enzyme related to lactoylglutathione lyase
MGHAVNWFQISGRGDAKALQKFYKQAFGWKMKTAPDGRMSMVDREKGGIAGGIGPSMSGEPSVAVYIESDKLEKDLARVEKAGGHAAMQPMDLPAGMGRIAGFVDPDGNWIGLWEAGKPVKKGAAKKGAKKKGKK